MAKRQPQIGENARKIYRTENFETKTRKWKQMALNVGENLNVVDCFSATLKVLRENKLIVSVVSSFYFLSVEGFFSSFMAYLT